MSSTHADDRGDRMLDPVVECLAPAVARCVADLTSDPLVQSRLDDLAAKASAGTLTPDERRSYEDFVEAIDVVAILKAKARGSLVPTT